jgi:hypothetical protein
MNMIVSGSLALRYKSMILVYVDIGPQHTTSAKKKLIKILHEGNTH